MPKQRKAILDTDPGIDDMLAIMLAYCSPELRLLGVTVVNGNVHTDVGTSNALATLDSLGAKHVPVCTGCWHPLLRPARTQLEVYGAAQDSGLPFDPHWASRADSRHAVNFLIEQVCSRPGEVTLFTLAPLTNIAAAIIMEKRFAPSVGEIFMMGGAAMVSGNTSTVAEFNLYVDPEAARVVFESGIPITMVGLDVTGKTALHPSDAPTLDALGTPVAEFIRQITRHYLDFSAPCTLFDPLAVAVGMQPSLVKRAVQARVDVEVIGEFAAGATIVDLPGTSGRSANARVCLEVDSEAFLKLFWERVIDSGSKEM
jgi:purine nucleosidase